MGQRLEKKFSDLAESEARDVIKSAVAVGVFQGGLLLVLLWTIVFIAVMILRG